MEQTSPSVSATLGSARRPTGRAQRFLAAKPKFTRSHRRGQRPRSEALPRLRLRHRDSPPPPGAVPTSGSRAAQSLEDAAALRAEPGSCGDAAGGGGRRPGRGAAPGTGGASPCGSSSANFRPRATADPGQGPQGELRPTRAGGGTAPRKRSGCPGPQIAQRLLGAGERGRLAAGRGSGSGTAGHPGSRGSPAAGRLGGCPGAEGLAGAGLRGGRPHSPRRPAQAPRGGAAARPVATAAGPRAGRGGAGGGEAAQPRGREAGRRPPRAPEPVARAGRGHARLAPRPPLPTPPPGRLGGRPGTGKLSGSGGGPGSRPGRREAVRSPPPRPHLTPAPRRRRGHRGARGTGIRAGGDRGCARARLGLEPQPQRQADRARRCGRCLTFSPVR